MPRARLWDIVVSYPAEKLPGHAAVACLCRSAQQAPGPLIGAQMELDERRGQPGDHGREQRLLSKEHVGRAQQA